MTIKYEVEYFDEEEPNPKWILAGLEMCREGFLCEECKKDINHLDWCDNIFDFTFSKQVALDKIESLKRDGFKVRLIERRKGETNENEGICGNTSECKIEGD